MPRVYKAKKYASGVDFGDMRPFPVCCSAKNLCSIGLRFTDAGDKLAPNVQAKIPNNIKRMNKTTGQRLMNSMPATLRAWPVRIWYSFLLYQMWDKMTSGAGGGDGYRTKTFIVSDNVGGPRRFERGSGFAEWCKRVPGIKVTSSGDYPGAHGGTCQSYIITITNQTAVKNYIAKSQQMVNTRLGRLRRSPERQRRGANVQRDVAAPNRFDAARYW